MLFNSVQYALFLVAVVGIYQTLSRRRQNLLLLAASYVFYGSWDWRFLGLIWVSTLTDFVVGRAIGRSDDDRRRKHLLWVSVAVNLGLLGFFKYFGFFTESFAGLLDRFGVQADFVTLAIVLPVGISFYTFQTLSYTVDVYRREMEATDDLLGFAVFVAFFPQLVAGPIERAQRLLQQFERKRPRLTADAMGSGLLLILVGLFKKVVIADSLAPIVDDIFAGSGQSGFVTLVFGAWAFAIQLYGDFSGYSSIARGSARLLGIELMVNFNQPYLSRNIASFWRHWHISLSTWIRDYIFIPLGGSRGSGYLTARNLLITFVLSGLWHGAAWTFVVWGALHGVFLIIHRWSPRRVLDDSTILPGLRDLPGIILTFNLYAASLIFFRSDSLGDAVNYIKRIITLRPGAVSGDAVLLVVLMALFMVLVDLAQRGNPEKALRWPPVAQGVAYGSAVVGILLFSGQGTVPFVYFQF